tara:strand:- start:198 stop:662 length:465 start_codon:yes stop_codon:yes gene_type:complete
METSIPKKVKTLDEAIADMLQDVRKQYEKRIGYEINDSSRLSAFVQDRTALSNALRPYTTLAKIGELFGKDHSSIVHYMKEHDAMMKAYPNYQLKFNTAMDVVQSITTERYIYPTMRKSRSRNLYSELEAVRKTIYNMRELEKRIELTLAFGKS